VVLRPIVRRTCEPTLGTDGLCPVGRKYYDAWVKEVHACEVNPLRDPKDMRELQRQMERHMTMCAAEGLKMAQNAATRQPERLYTPTQAEMTWWSFLRWLIDHGRLDDGVEPERPYWLFLRWLRQRGRLSEGMDG